MVVEIQHKSSRKARHSFFLHFFFVRGIMWIWNILNFRSRQFVFVFVFFSHLVFVEVWKQDVSDLFQIEPSTQGIQNVHLKCGANSMFVNLKTENDFTGVMYTKGNFYDQNEPCFVASKRQRGTRSLQMRFNFDQCNTKTDGNLFTNVIVVQNDPELVTPGDAAFSLRTFDLDDKEKLFCVLIS